MYKKKYERSELEIIEFKMDDAIMTSPVGPVEENDELPIK